MRERPRHKGPLRSLKVKWNTNVRLRIEAAEKPSERTGWATEGDCKTCGVSVGVGEVARWTGRRDRWRRIWLLGFFTRIVRRINEGHLERPGIEKLEDRLLVGCEDPMSVIGRHY